MPLKYRTINPSDSLKDYVRFYWFLESDEPYTHHSMADVCPELIFHYQGQFHEIFNDGRRELSFISGISAPSSLPRKFTIDECFGMFGTYLYPHAIPLLFDVPVNELTNQMVDLDTLNRKSGADLEDQIMNTVSDRQRIQIIESFVLQRLQQQQTLQLPVIMAFRSILNTAATHRVSALSSDFFVSERQLERQFKKFTGFAPKQFMRISRFQNALLRQHGNPDIRLTDLALECGYADQSHFIRDFKQFSGISPKAYFKEKIPAATDWRNAEG